MSQYMPGFNPPIKQKQPNYLRIILLVVLGAVVLYVLITFLFVGFVVSDVMGMRFENLKSVSFSSPNDGWAIGTSTSMKGPMFINVAYHYHDGQWTKQEISSTNSIILDVAMVSANEGWIVGDSNTLVHYLDGQWRDVAGPKLTSYALNAVAALAPDKVWAVGNGTMIHYDGKSWSKVELPAGAAGGDIQMLNPNEGWAVGGSILQYKDGRWQEQSRPASGPLARVFMLDSNEGWAVGGNDSSSNPSCTLLQYSGGAWKNVDCPAKLPIKGIYMVSANEGWAVGGGFYKRNPEDKDRPKQSLLLHYHDGKWQPEQLPSNAELNDILMLSPTEGWAVGDGIWHYKDGTWSAYQQQLGDSDMAMQTPARQSKTNRKIIILAVVLWLVVGLTFLAFSSLADSSC